MKLRTIGAAAVEVGVTPGTLRIWERLGLLSAVRDSGGRRIYTDANVDAGKAILQLRLARRGCGLRNQNDEAA